MVKLSLMSVRAVTIICGKYIRILFPGESEDQQKHCNQYIQYILPITVVTDNHLTL